MDNAVIVVQKKWYESKVFWLNIITFFSMLGTILSPVKLDPVSVEIVGVIVAASNVALRLWFTGAPVTDAGARAAETGGTAR